MAKLEPLSSHGANWDLFEGKKAVFVELDIDEESLEIAESAWLEHGGEIHRKPSLDNEFIFALDYDCLIEEFATCGRCGDRFLLTHNLLTTKWILESIQHNKLMDYSTYQLCPESSDHHARVQCAHVDEIRRKRKKRKIAKAAETDRLLTQQLTDAVDFILADTKFDEHVKKSLAMLPDD